MSKSLFSKAEKESNEVSIIGSSYLTFICPNCTRKIHCIAGGKAEAPVELLKDRCNNDNCECRCRRFYVARNGRLRRYGTIDDTDVMAEFSPITERTPVDDLIDELNATNKPHVVEESTDSNK